MTIDWKILGVIVSVVVTVGGLVFGGVKGYNYLQFTVERNTEAVEGFQTEIEELDDSIKDLDYQIRRLYDDITEQNMGRSTIYRPMPITEDGDNE